MKWRPKVTYNNGADQVLTLTIAQRPWVPESVGVGGSDESSAGVPESFEVWRHEILSVTLRFFESEWSAVGAWLRWAQRTAGGFDFYPDRDLSTFLTCYLHSPRMGEPIRPERGDYTGTYELTISIRTTSGAEFDARYFG